MTDRATGNSTYGTAGFDSRWGGGRFQARFHNATDMGGGAWAWETWSVVLTNGQVADHPMAPSGPVPSGANQLKVYSMVFEDDQADIARINLDLRDKDCGSGNVSLGSDTSYDVKKMVRLGSSAVGKDVCVRLSAAHVPAGQSRRVHVYGYFSPSTVMR